MNKIFKLKTAVVAFATIAAVCMMSQDANAQHRGHGHGGGYGHHGGGHGHGGHNFNRGGFSISIGGGGYGGFNRGPSIGQGVYSGGIRNYGSIGRSYGYGGFNAYRPTYSTYRAPRYHDTTHLDYYGPRLVPHGNHYDYIPGHYGVHRTGHWHR